VIAVLLVIWGMTGFYRVQPDEHGVVLRFGQWVRTEELPGLKYHLPAPIESVLLPKVTRVNSVEVGYRTGGDPRRPGAERDVPDESLILTGDENIIDIDFVVFWQIGNARDYLFQLREPDGTVRRAAESAMREVVGNNKIETVQTEGRVVVQQDVQKLMQRILDGYNAGVTITRVILLKVDPPTQVIDAFRDVQAARADQEKRRNEAQKYQNTVVPQARGEVTKIVQDAEAYKQKLITEAQGEAQRFLSILEQYKNAKQVTRERMYLETMQRVLGSTNKIVIESKNGMIQGIRT
jgi:membrane protease subunit HflK